ncbi:hemerythrin domain-containing protein [Falsiroseomonas sp. CW058]|uniref:hemerythrin domain-containing protein n=1 Tax=Falsiroseomonas sp. CW058 TaxID=3388664 RepID=UPI003D310C13
MSTLLAPAFGVAPLARALLEDPVAFLSAEHGRQMALLSHLERLVRAPAARGARVMAQALLRWLGDELPLHIADEECSLYPRLRALDQGGTLDRLSADHRRDARLAATTMGALRRMAAGEEAGQRELDAAVEFARLHRRHLELEEATIMPLARDGLSAETKASLAREMATRRGLAGGDTCPTAP